MFLVVFFYPNTTLPLLAVLVQRLIPSTPEEGCWLLPQHCTAAALSLVLRARGLSPIAELLPQSWDHWDTNPHPASPLCSFAQR